MLQTFLPETIATILFPRVRDIVYRPDDVSVKTLRTLNTLIKHVSESGNVLSESNYNLSTRQTNNGTWLYCRKVDHNDKVKSELSVKVDEHGVINFAELSSCTKTLAKFMSESEQPIPKQIVQKINELCALNLGQEATPER